MGKTLIGTATTDSNGVASVSYVGEGAGILNIQAETSDGTLCSLPLEIYDTLFYQAGTTEPPSNTWIISGFTPSYTSDGTTLTSTTFATCFANLPGSGVNAFDWDSPVAIEFDVVSFTSTDADLQIYDNTNNVAKSFSALSISNGSHLKILVESNQIRYFIDGTERTGAKWTGTITFKNFMIYPV